MSGTLRHVWSRPYGSLFLTEKFNSTYWVRQGMLVKRSGTLSVQSEIHCVESSKLKRTNQLVVCSDDLWPAGLLLNLGWTLKTAMVTAVSTDRHLTFLNEHLGGPSSRQRVPFFTKKNISSISVLLSPSTPIPLDILQALGLYITVTYEFSNI